MTATGTLAARSLAVVAAIVAVLLWAAGCGGTPAGSSAPATTVSPAPGRSASATPQASSGVPPTSYRPVGNVCPAVDVSAFAQRVGKAELKPTAWVDRTGSSTLLSCTVRLGSLGNAGAVIVVAEVFDDRSAQQPFRRLREQQDSTTPLTGVGTEAYSYLDAGNRPHVVAYDANLHLIVQYVPNTPLNHPQDLVPALTEVCKATITGLQRLGVALNGGGGMRPAK